MYYRGLTLNLPIEKMNHLEFLRNTCGLTNAQLAKIMYIRSDRLRKYELGHAIPLDAKIMFSRMYGLHMDILFNRKNSIPDETLKRLSSIKNLSNQEKLIFLGQHLYGCQPKIYSNNGISFRQAHKKFCEELSRLTGDKE